MEGESWGPRLSQITTAWTVFGEAHLADKEGEARHQAQAKLLRRYGAAIYRYLLGALRDEDVADELFQEFALRFVRGDFHRADSSRGRFRDYLKAALFRLIIDAQRRRNRTNELRPLPEGASGESLVIGEDGDAPGEEADQRFLDVWRAELIGLAWSELKEFEAKSGQPLHAVLRLRCDEPALRSAEMADRLSVSLGRPVTAGWARKRLLFARERFTDALLDAVARSLAEPTRENVEQELIDLGLLGHCRDALERRYPRAGSP